MNFRVLAGSIATLASILTSASAYGSADARTRTSPAKGTKDCVISQSASEYLEQKYQEIKATAGVPFYMKKSSYMKFTVLRSGGVNVSIAENTYPGSKFYFMIDGKRYSGDARYQLPLDAKAVAALRADKLINFTYTGWPDRNEMSREDIFAGFSAAYTECLTFLGAGSKTQPAFAPISLTPRATSR